MYKDKTILAVIPARGGSKGLPNKNIKNLCGKPLVGWPIQAALNSKYVDKVIVSTDSAEISEIAKNYGADIPFIRPDQLASDTATSYAVLEHAIYELRKSNEEYDYILMLEPTSPLTDADDIDNALNKLLNTEDAESIVGVCKSESGHPSFSALISTSGFLKPYEQEEFKFLRRQDITDVYYFSGSLYLSRVETLLNKKSFYHDKTIAAIDPKWKAFEIDDIVDFIILESLITNKNKFTKND